MIAGGPDLGGGSMAERLARFRAEHDGFRSAVVNEPRGSDVIVGALLCEPVDPGCAAGVIFFNNVGYLGMCGHGTIGLVVTLAHLGRIAPGEHRIETPVGTVTTTLHEIGRSDGRECAELSHGAAGVGGSGRLSGPWSGTSPGAATGSSWWNITARKSRWRTSSA